MASAADDAQRLLILGLGETGRSTVDAVTARGLDVVVVDDRPSAEACAHAEGHGLDLVVGPEAGEWAALVDGVDALVPSPGVPETHPCFTAASAAHVPVISEFDLASRWDDRPRLAITGTDGKTTVTTMTVDMLTASGVRTIGVGNTDTPLIEAIADPQWDVFVVEASSFRLGYSQHFAPLVGTWLNLGPDHLDKHRSLETYEQAKAAIWSHLPPDGLAVAPANSDVVLRHLPADRRHETFGLDAGDHRVVDGVLHVHGEPIIATDDLYRTLPHDLTNALAAAATALAGGATREGVTQALRNFRGLPHRVELIADADGIRWFNDSKATTPHATVAALRGFDDVVLIAGGLNKGLDMSDLRAEASRLRALVTIGSGGPDVAEVFAGLVPIVEAETMDRAVTEASSIARAGDTVLLSPACASFDQYTGYAERGRDFTRRVTQLVSSDPTTPGARP